MPTPFSVLRGIPFFSRPFMTAGALVAKKQGKREERVVFNMPASINRCWDMDQFRDRYRLSGLPPPAPSLPTYITHIPSRFFPP